MKFKPENNFINNFELVLKELNDPELMGILKNRINDILNCPSGENQFRNNIINDLEALIEARVRKKVYRNDT